MIDDYRAVPGAADNLAAAVFAANASKVVAQHGITLSISDDFDDFMRAREFLRDDPVTSIFDPSQSDIKPGWGFWLLGTHKGQPVQVQAVRFFDLETNLADHLFQMRNEYAMPGVEIDLDRSRFDVAPITANITGRVGYHGEFFLARAFRGGGLTAIIPRILMVLSLSYQPDYLFGLQDKAKAYLGLGAKEGYFQVYMRGIRWLLECGKWHDEAIVWMSSGDLQCLPEFLPNDVFDEVHYLNPRNRKEEREPIQFASYR